MTDGQTSIETAIAEIENLRKVLKQQTSKQVQSEDEKQSQSRKHSGDCLVDFF